VLKKVMVMTGAVAMLSLASPAYAGGGLDIADNALAGGIANGAVSNNTVKVPVKVPVNVCGVSTAVVGKSGAQCKGGASASGPSHHHHHHGH
jgi:hypothetical protein